MRFSSKVIIVSGIPRSGTTLANRLLCASPRCAQFLPECSFITRQIEQYANIISYADRERFETYFATRENCRDCFKRCVEAHLSALLVSSPGIADREFLVLKDPMLVHHFGAIEELMPQDTRTVLTVRNPLGVLASMKNVKLAAGGAWDIDSTIKDIFDFYFSLYRTRENSGAGSVCFVRYEDLVRDEWSALESFLEFSISGAIVAEKHTRQIDRLDPFYSPLYDKPVSDERIDAWQAELSESEIAKVREAFAGVMDYWGYAC